MSSKGMVKRALNNAWSREHGGPDLKVQWIELHYERRIESLIPPPLT